MRKYSLLFKSQVQRSRKQKMNATEIKLIKYTQKIHIAHMIFLGTLVLLIHRPKKQDQHDANQ